MGSLTLHLLYKFLLACFASTQYVLITPGSLVGSVLQKLTGVVRAGAAVNILNYQGRKGTNCL